MNGTGLGKLCPGDRSGSILSNYTKHLQCMYSGTFKSFHGMDKSICLHNRVKRLKTSAVLKFQEKKCRNYYSPWAKHALSVTSKENFLYCWHHNPKLNSEYNIKILFKDIQCNAMQAMQSKLPWNSPSAISHKCQEAIWLKLYAHFSNVSRTTLEGPNERHLNRTIQSETRALVLFRLPFKGVVLVFQTWRTWPGNTAFFLL